MLLQRIIQLQKYFNNIVLFLKKVGLGPSGAPKNLKTSKVLYQLLLNIWTKFYSEAAMLLSLYSKKKLLLSLPLDRR